MPTDGVSTQNASSAGRSKTQQILKSPFPMLRMWPGSASGSALSRSLSPLNPGSSGQKLLDSSASPHTPSPVQVVPGDQRLPLAEIACRVARYGRSDTRPIAWPS